MATREERLRKLRTMLFGELTDLQRRIGGKWIGNKPSEKEEIRARDCVLDLADREPDFGARLDVCLKLVTNDNMHLAANNRNADASQLAAYAAVSSVIISILALIVSILVWCSRN